MHTKAVCTILYCFLIKFGKKRLHFDLSIVKVMICVFRQESYWIRTSGISSPALTDLSPGYVQDMPHPYQSQWALWSMNVAFLKRPNGERKTVGGRSFAVVVPKLWHKIPLTLSQAMEIEGFKSALKTHLFKKAYSD